MPFAPKLTLPATIFAALSAILLLAGCRQNPEGPVTIGTNIWLGYEPGYVAAKRGLYGDAQVTMRQFPSASETLRAFRNGSIDIAALTLDEALLLAQRGIAIRIIFVTDISNGADAIIAKPGMQSVSDLRGTRVGVEGNALGDYLLSRALQLHGLAENQITPVSMTVDETIEAYQSGRVDAVVTFEPFKTALINQGGVKVFDSSDIPDEILDVLVVREDFANSHPKAIKAVVKGWLEASLLVNSQRPDVLHEIAGRLEMTDSELRRALLDLRIPSAEENVHLLTSSSGLIAISRKLVPVLERHNHAALDIAMDRLPTADFLPADPQ